MAEIEVIDLSVKPAGASLRIRSSVMEMLNLRIPNPCIFRKYELAKEKQRVQREIENVAT